jgi:hypothetical protein
MMLAAVSMTATPALAASDASALSIARAAPTMVGASFLQDEEQNDNEGGGSTAVILGVVLVVLIGVAAIAGSGEPNNPHSP